MVRAVTIKWDGTCWFSVERLEEIERTEEWRAEKIASHRIPEHDASQQTRGLGSRGGGGNAFVLVAGQAAIRAQASFAPRGLVLTRPRRL